MSSYRIVKLSEVAEVGAGNSAPQKKEMFHEGTHPFVRTSDVGQIRFGTISTAADLLNDKGIKGLRLVPKGTILMPKSGASTFLNHRVETSVDCYVSSHLATVTAKPDKAIPRYLLYFLSTVQAQDLIQDHKYPSLTLGVIGSIEVNLPPLEEQKRIVAVLDQAFAALDRARALAEANLTDAGELFEATKRHFSSFGADQATTVSLGEVVSIAAKLVDPKLPAHLDLPHIGAGNMVTGTDDLVDIQTAREEGLKSGKFPFAAGVVLYSKIRPYLRKVARPDFDGLCSADVYPLTPSKHLDRDYLFHLLLSEDFTAYAIAGSARAGMPKVNQEHLFAYRFDLPPVEAQRAIAQRIDAALVSRKRLDSLMEGKVAHLTELRQSLLQKAFAGGLT